MRLLNTKTLEFKEFDNEKIPPYAILSHRWRDEITHQDFLSRRKQDSSGFRKITKACEVVANDSLHNGGEHGSWIWIDTCCIDKTSSTELSESINSMWRWYQNADICYVYLDDVPERLSTMHERQNLLSFKARFRHSEWFQRGWTLQELLAPQNVEFLSQTWTRLGSKAEFLEDIAVATGIQQRIILGGKNAVNNCCAAEKLSWAAERITSKEEDTAYCLLGLLDINMPLLYGEGMKAFMRLQEEYIRSKDDESIFAWSSIIKRKDTFALSPYNLLPRVDEAWQEVCTLHLAISPAQYSSCGNIQSFHYTDREVCQITNKGLQIDAVLIPVPNRKNEFFAPINCRVSGTVCELGDEAPLALHLTQESYGENIYLRKGCVNLANPEFSHIRWSLKWKPVKGILDTLVFSLRRYTMTRMSKRILFFTLVIGSQLLMRMPQTFYSTVSYGINENRLEELGNLV